MRTIYVDSDKHCHIEDTGKCVPVETSFFDGKCKEFVEGYCCSTEEGVAIWPFRDYDHLAEMQVVADREGAAKKVLDEMGITIEPMPDPPERPGYHWIRVQKVAGGSITCELSDYDPTMPGTMETPMEFEDGMTVKQNFFYIRDGVRKVWMGAKDATPSWDDDDFVEF